MATEVSGEVSDATQSIIPSSEVSSEVSDGVRNKFYVPIGMVGKEQYDYFVEHYPEFANLVKNKVPTDISTYADAYYIFRRRYRHIVKNGLLEIVVKPLHHGHFNPFRKRYITHEYLLQGNRISIFVFEYLTDILDDLGWTCEIIPKNHGVKSYVYKEPRVRTESDEIKLPA